MTVKISAFAELLPAAASGGDLFEVVDVSDTSGAPTGTNKKFQLGSIGTYLQNANAFLQAGAAQANDEVAYWEDAATGRIRGSGFGISQVARRDQANTYTVNSANFASIQTTGPGASAWLDLFANTSTSIANRRRWRIASGDNPYMRISARTDADLPDGVDVFRLHHPGGTPANGGVTSGDNASPQGAGTFACDALYEFDGGADTRVPGLKRSETWQKGHQAVSWVSVATAGAYTLDPANGNYFLFTVATGTLNLDITGTGFSGVFRIANSAVVLNTANFDLVLPSSLPTGNNRVGSAHIDNTGFKTLVLWGSA